MPETLLEMARHYVKEGAARIARQEERIDLWRREGRGPNSLVEAERVLEILRENQKVLEQYLQEIEDGSSLMHPNRKSG
jgi:hypothetical protein